MLQNDPKIALVGEIVKDALGDPATKVVLLPEQNLF